ncbi:ethanolamine ammonia-lyase subunit EutB [Arenibacter sp. GZD96]|uniref:ethanolamine ammonia-lyase subunit EutB n=1 Tax=Aurantibrevibacter litoralis TaxID=3106030 RepID=UPI002AFF962D|nr:ethanolamine ammonia-lyase subunit EutB [Arenibacter sp. GZD-96]MEA1787421.1 ethanolamine ammonia-lyase subunit EutB [Arenibacter sp. GZD-96]
MTPISRKRFMAQTGILASTLILTKGCGLISDSKLNHEHTGVHVGTPQPGEDLFSYIQRTTGGKNLSLYRQILGAANEFKEGDLTLGISADSEASRKNARTLLFQTKIGDINTHPVYEDDVWRLIRTDTTADPEVEQMTLYELKQFVLTRSEADIKKIMPALSSDCIGCLVKLMPNQDLIEVGQKVFNPLPNSKIGSKGYLSARIQPNSPTDNIEDITWQVFNAWSYAVGDLVLGTNPVSSESASVAKIEAALFDIITTFKLQDIIPHCVLAHIDVQAEVEKKQPGTTGVWFQSLAGTVNANATFDVTIAKMVQHLSKRTGQYGLYGETGQGADFTNGHGEGFDMVLHESRKYGFVRALKAAMTKGKSPDKTPWVFVNDVAGFIGPEVFRTKEQLVRCCLEDTVMGKLHGLTIGLDICSTLHMDVTLDDLNWCIDQIMPANPAYLMALPTKNDPMLSYLTTAFNDHVRIRHQFGYKVNDAMWDFFKKLEVIDELGHPTLHFGDPLWVYYQYQRAKNDTRSKKTIYEEGQQCMQRIQTRGVPIAQGFGKNHWDLEPKLEAEVRRLYEDAKISLWTEMNANFVASISGATHICTKSVDRQDYVYHPESGEKLSPKAIAIVNNVRRQWGNDQPDVQLLISDGLNARALMDEGHLRPFLERLRQGLQHNGFRVSNEHIVITHGRVRAGYACGELLFGASENAMKKGIIHIIGERPGSGHHNFSAYLTAATPQIWNKKGSVDHNITRVISGISDTALTPEKAVIETLQIFEGLMHS